MTNPIEDKHIIVGVTGSVAAYKAVEIASKLTQAGAFVDVVLTQAAEKFVTPIQFQSVTGRTCFTDKDLWGGQAHVLHVGLGHSTNLLVIAPASANTIAKLANGIADNLLTVTVLAAKCPIVVAPAMDAGMYSHIATQTNVKLLEKRGVHFLGPVVGRMASGLVGLGRFIEPADIVSTVRWILGTKGLLKGKRIVVTAGGTREPIDPVRVITNRSSGKQGYAVAQAALDAGAQVTLITTCRDNPEPGGAIVKKAETAAEVEQLVLDNLKGTDALIMIAAVADFRVAKPAASKIKKDSLPDSLKLEPTDDILLKVAEKKTKTHFPKVVIGFAAESENLLKNATIKLTTKKLDMIVANDISSKGAGFEEDTNKVTFLTPDGKTEPTQLLSKVEIADIILGKVTDLLLKK
jgi:phosphopantothenoylcysteine decarboxylase/phosphopantothenate--cysteine ligase